MAEHKTFSHGEICDIEKGLPLREILSDDVKLGICPYCHRQSFRYNDSHYLCENCQAYGNAIAYLMCNQTLSFTESVLHCQGLLKAKEVQ